jgi:hypothetical protein
MDFYSQKMKRKLDSDLLDCGRNVKFNPIMFSIGTVIVNADSAIV